MRFGWQGFRFDHPDDWAPAELSGSRREGRVRLASTGKAAVQVRWKETFKPGDLSVRLRSYFGRLEGEARRAGQPFKSESEWDGEHLLYRWFGGSERRGALFVGPGCGRVFFLELAGEPHDALDPRFASVLESFASGPVDGLEPWALLGLDVALPERLVLERKTLLPGRTGLSFRGRGCRVRADSWAFGAQLVAKHGLEPWARDVLRLPRAEAEADRWGVRLTQPGRLGRPRVEALARFDENSNQMVVVTVVGKRIRPEWDWLV